MCRDTNTWSIRVADHTDWDQISQLEKNISDEEGIGGYITDIGSAYLDLGTTYVAEDNGIAGFQNVRDVQDGSIYLSGLRVSKPYRRKGVATTLIKYILNEAADKGKIIARTYVETTNLSSLSLMKNLGFVKSGKMNFFFGSVDLTGFEAASSWPDTLVDIGHLPSFPYSGIPATLLRKDKRLVSVCHSNKWEKEPTYTVLSSGKYKFNAGKSFISISSSIRVNSQDNLTPVRGFESAYLLEFPLNKT